MNLFNNILVKKIFQKIFDTSYLISYSQTGEDLILQFLIESKKLKNFNYLDIGANHPVKINNTFKFYEDGYSGVCIEPNPKLFKVLANRRKRDICLNIGISDTNSEFADYYMMDNHVLNTFSKEEAQQMEISGLSKIQEVIKVPVKTVESIIEENFNGSTPVLINIDVEGLDELILNSFPFSKYRPYVFCIETVAHTNDASSQKREIIFEIMRNNNYTVFADTYINTIFIDTFS